MLIKRIFTLLFLVALVATIFAQNTSKGDSHSTNQNTVIKIEGIQGGWFKGNNDISSGINTTTSSNENVSFITTSEGIYITIIKDSNKINCSHWSAIT